MRGVINLGLTPVLGIHIQICAWFVNLLFLGHSLTTMLVYIWARRNPFVRMNFFGLLPFRVWDKTFVVHCPFINPLLTFLTGSLSSLGLGRVFGFVRQQRSSRYSGYSSLYKKSVLFGSILNRGLCAGIAIGHLYFFLEDVFPNQPGGRRLLATPRILYDDSTHLATRRPLG